MSPGISETQNTGFEPSSVLSTNDVGPRQRPSYWVELICDVFVQLDCNKVANDFYGHIADRPLGDIRFSEVHSTTQHVSRSPRMLSRASDDCMLLSLQTSGRGVVEQDGRQAVLEPGDFALYDSTRRYDLKFDGNFSQMVVKTPRSMFVDRLAGAESMTATRVLGSSGMGRVASSFIREVAREAHTLLPHEIERVTHNAIDILTAALSHSLLDKPVARHSTKSAQLVRIKMFVDNNLAVSDLSPEKIASANGISVRYLNKLFENEGASICRWLWDQRLQRIAQDLSDPTLSSSNISEIALRWGFNNLSHFSRLFKERYHKCARDYRVTSLQQ